MDRIDIGQKIIGSLKPELINQKLHRIKITFPKRVEFNRQLPQRSASVKLCKTPKLQIYSSPNTTYKTDSYDKFKANIHTWKQIQNPKVLNLGKNRKQQSSSLIIKNECKFNLKNRSLIDNGQIQTSQVKRYEDSSIFKREESNQSKNFEAVTELKDCLRLVEQMSTQIKNIRLSMQQSLMKSKNPSYTEFCDFNDSKKNQFKTPVKSKQIYQQQLTAKYENTDKTRHSQYTIKQAYQQQKNQSQNASNGSVLNHFETSSRIIYQTPKKFFA